MCLDQHKPSPWAGKPLGPKIQSAHPQTSRGRGPEPAPRGGGPLCPLQCPFIRKPPPRRAANALGPITPQRRQPRVPPLPRIDSRQTEPPRPRERVGVRAKRPLFCAVSPASLISYSTLSGSTLSASGRGVRAKRPLGLSDQRMRAGCGSLPNRGVRNRFQICSLPIGTMVSRRTPSGADTEVRPPATLFLAPGGRCARLNAQRTGADPIQVGSLPIGTVISRQTPSGADTEVRPPATLTLWRKRCQEPLFAFPGPRSALGLTESPA